MNAVTRFLTFVLSAGAILLAAPSSLRAESGVPDPGQFFGDFPDYDEGARGTKLTGTLTISYVFLDALACADPGLPDVPQLLIANMYVVLTLKGNDKPVQPFNANFATSGTPVFCFSTGTRQQVDVVLNLIRDSVIPSFFECVPGECPNFKIKSLKNFQSTGTGAISSSIVIAVR
jgi:hypothetical protein